MSGETTITVVGNLTADPELRFTQSGVAVANFTVASTPRRFDKDANEWKDGDALFLRCNIWREASENVADSLTKGMRVIVIGQLQQRSYEKDGQNRVSYELLVDEVGPALKYATVRVERKSKGSSNGGQQRSQQRQRDVPNDDPWSTSRSTGNNDPWAAPSQEEPPF